MEFDADCPFCKIGVDPGFATTEIVAQGANWLALFPENPATPGHTLILPRAHVRNLWVASEELAAELMEVVVRLGQAVDAALHPDGMNLITSDGSSAEQTVFHLHLHIVPRWEDDGFGHIWPLEHRYEHANMTNVADRLRSAFARREHDSPTS